MQTIHAPRVNLVTRTMMSTEPVITKPTALIMRLRSMLRRSLGERLLVRSSRFQCRIMPNWLRVNDTNTPRM